MKFTTSIFTSLVIYNYLWITTISFICDTITAIPNNDVCTDAEEITIGSTAVVSTIDATIDANVIDNCLDGTSPGYPGVWFNFTGTGERLVARSCRGYILYLSIYKGDCNTTQLQCVAATYYPCERERFIFDTVQGTKYHVLVQTFYAEVVNLSIFPLPIVTNDLCINAQPIAIGSNVTTNATYATADTYVVNNCVDGTPPYYPGVWFNFTGTGERLVARFCSNYGSSYISIYKGECDPSQLQCVAAITEPCNRERFVFESILGTKYHVLVQSYYDEIVDLSIFPLPNVINDVCINAQPFTIGSSVNMNVTYATSDTQYVDDNCLDGSPPYYPGVWFNFTGTGERLVARSCSFYGSVYISIYKGECDPLQLQCVAATKRPCDQGGRFIFDTIFGTKYHVLVQSYIDEIVDLSIFTVLDDNDFCTNAKSIAIGTSVKVNMINATRDSDVISDCINSNPPTYPGVWFNFTGTGDRLVTIACNASYYFNETRISIFKGGCEPSTLECVAGTSNPCGQQLSFDTEQGTVYHVLVQSQYVGIIDFLVLSAGMSTTPTPTIPSSEPSSAPVLVTSSTRAPTNVPLPVPAEAVPVTTTTRTPTNVPIPVPAEAVPVTTTTHTPTNVPVSDPVPVAAIPIISMTRAPIDDSVPAPVPAASVPIISMTRAPIDDSVPVPVPVTTITRTPTIVPVPVPAGDETMNVTRPIVISVVRGDPHITTLDGLEYDCQARGEFTLLQSRNTPFHIQSRFTKATTSGAGSTASVTTGLVIRETDAPTIQVSYQLQNADSIPGCLTLINLYENGIERTLQSGALSSKVSVTVVNGEEIVILFPATGLEVHVLVKSSSSFGCFFTQWIILPENYRANEVLFGLLGNANGNPNDDWQTNLGIVLPTPGNETALYQDAYDYCRTEWCIRTLSDSLFTYSSGESFESYFECETPYNSDIQDSVASASPELLQVCGTDIQCIVDGAIGSTSDAQSLVNDTIRIETVRMERNITYSDNNETITSALTKAPSKTPTKAPSNAPTKSPSIAPTKSPSKSPTNFPNKSPLATASPIISPIALPTIPIPKSVPAPGPVSAPEPIPIVVQGPISIPVPPRPVVIPAPVPIPFTIPVIVSSPFIVPVPKSSPITIPVSLPVKDDGPAPVPIKATLPIPALIPVPVPTKPSTDDVSSCGIFGNSYFCPFQLRGIIGRLFRRLFGG